MLTDKELEDIRRKMLELDEETPAWAWSSIQAEIKPKRRWRLFWWLAPALLLVTATSVFFFWDKSDLTAVAPSVAHMPSEQPVSAHVGQENTSKADKAPKPAVAKQQQLPSLPAKRANSDSAIDKQPQLKNPAFSVNESPEASPIRQPGNKIHNQNIENGKELNQQNKNQPEKNTRQLAIIQDKTGNKPNDKIKPKEKAGEQTNNLPANKFSDKKPGEPGNEQLPLEKVDVNKIISRDKNDLAGKRKENNHPDTTQPTEIPIGTDETTISGTAKPAPSSTEEIVLSPDKARAPLSPVEQITPDSTGIAIKTDTASIDKEVMIITPEEKHPSKEWTIGLFFSPRYSFRIVKPSGSDDVYITGLSSRKKAGSERMGYELGLNISKAISHNLYLESSLAFMQLKENLSYSFTTGKVDTLLRQVSSDGQRIDVTALYTTSNRQLVSSYVYGGWRLGATYYFWQNERRRFNLTLNGGVNLLVKGRTQEIIDGQESRMVYFPSKENILEQTNYNLLVGAGYSMQVMQKYELMLMPTLNYFLGSTFQTREPFGLQPYSLGIHAQLKRRIKG